MASASRPTSIRYVVVGLTTLVAVMLYVDRLCLGFVKTYIQENLRLSDDETNFLIGAFFYTYAFGQIPAGWLSDRFGARRMLTLYIAVWSLLTALMGVAQTFGTLILLRLGCGLFEAGAYPACAGLIRRWVPYRRRGFASSVVSLGGRLGGGIVPVLTAYLMVAFVPISKSSLLTWDDILNVRILAENLGDLGEPRAPLAETLAPPLWNKLTEQTRLALKEAGPPALTGPTGHYADRTIWDWFRRTYRNIAGDNEKDPSTPDVLPAQQAEIVADLNRLLRLPNMADGIDLKPFRGRLPAEALRLFDAEPSSLSEAQIERRNRLLLEVAFPKAIRKVYGEGWRPAIMLYGGVGLMLALVFWLVFRDSPRSHPHCNAEEAALIEADDAAAASVVPVSARRLWRGILTSRGLWLSSFVQFGTNFGWIFLANSLPEYLQTVHQVPEQTRGWMASLPFLVGLPMLLVGGWWTDWLTRLFGARVGRCLPLVVTRFLTSAAFLTCIWLEAPWEITMAMCVVSVASDIGLPAIWAYCLDVGGPNVGLVLGWGNMWGNLGAALSPSLLGWILADYGWKAVFTTCAAVYAVIGFAALGIDATREIVPVETTQAPGVPR